MSSLIIVIDSKISLVVLRVFFYTLVALAVLLVVASGTLLVTYSVSPDLELNLGSLRMPKGSDYSYYFVRGDSVCSLFLSNKGPGPFLQLAQVPASSIFVNCSICSAIFFICLRYCSFCYLSCSFSLILGSTFLLGALLIKDAILA